MKIETQKIEMPVIDRVREISTKEETKSTKESPKKKVTEESAKIVARKLQSHSDNTVRFVVKDYDHVSPRNIVIEILNDKNEVIARIPEEKISEIEGGSTEELPTGLVVDQTSN